MYQYYIPQYTTLMGALWDMEKVHCWICEIGLLGMNCIIEAKQAKALGSMYQECNLIIYYIYVI